MILGALIDAGLPLKIVKEELKKLSLKNYSISKKTVLKNGIKATKFNVKVSEQKAHRHFSDIEKIIEKSTLDQTIKQDSIKIFTKLAQCEAKIHKTTFKKVHFHEVGAVDSIIDIVGTAIGMHFFKIDNVYSSAIALGSGTINSAHGIIPVPSPATLSLCKDLKIVRTNIAAELTTPTGAAVLAALTKKNSLPPIYTSKAVGYGAGKRDLPDQANVLRCEIGEINKNSADQIIYCMEVNIDDMNPENYTYLSDELFRMNALDVFLTPIIMKKGRPATKLSVLCSSSLINKLSSFILANTTTLGIRYYPVQRKILNRESQRVKTSLGTINAKKYYMEDKVYLKPEYTDCAKIAKQKGLSILDVNRILSRELDETLGN